MSWKGKTRGGLTGHLIFVFILKKFGLPAAYFVLRFVSFYFVFFAPKATKSAWNYFRFAHKYNVLKTAVSVYKNFYVFGQTLLDKIASMAGVNPMMGSRLRSVWLKHAQYYNADHPTISNPSGNRRKASVRGNSIGRDTFSSGRVLYCNARQVQRQLP